LRVKDEFDAAKYARFLAEDSGFDASKAGTQDVLGDHLHGASRPDDRARSLTDFVWSPFAVLLSSDSLNAEADAIEEILEEDEAEDGLAAGDDDDDGTGMGFGNGFAHEYN